MKNKWLLRGQKGKTRGRKLTEGLFCYLSRANEIRNESEEATTIFIVFQAPI